MTMNDRYAPVEPTRAEIDRLAGPSVVEFGAPWCGHCQAAQPLLAAALAGYPHIRHLKIEDGRGKPLGRSFRVKLWPTLVFLVDGKELVRLVRPDDANAIRRALAQIAAAGEPAT
ncbi:MAG TPA: thioredoxin family protein [Burkholderiaceae bacterium]|jgi:thioredoxin 1|nr:thioredoxin family protein [Burkholderiaceae bacterium]